VGRYAKEAATGGVLGGILSAIPGLNILNCCCCGLNILGAAFGLYLWFAKEPDGKLSIGDAAISGAISGCVTGVIVSIVNALMAPVSMSLIETYTKTADLPPELQDALSQVLEQQEAGSTMLVQLAQLPFTVALYGGFGLLGGMLAMQLVWKDRLQN
jgi:hypothetical protein